MPDITYTITADGKATIPKDPRERDAYGINLASVLAKYGAQGVTIASVTVAEAVGVAADGAVALTEAIAVVWVIGGTIGEDASITFRYELSNGAEKYQTIHFEIRYK